MELSPEDRNSVVRTMLSEDGRSAPGMAAVAWTIRNRAESGKFQDTPGGVVMARHAYEPWSLPRRDANHPLNHSATSPEYQQATRIADGVFSGETPDVTNGATHFYDPRAQAEEGRRVGLGASRSRRSEATSFMRQTEAAKGPSTRP